MVSHGRMPNRLRKYRRMNGYTQVALAKILGMKNASLISEWESGRITPSLDRLLDLYLVLKIPIEELFSERLHQRRLLLGPEYSKARIINQDIQKL